MGSSSSSSLAQFEFKFDFEFELELAIFDFEFVRDRLGFRARLCVRAPEKVLSGTPGTFPGGTSRPRPMEHPEASGKDPEKDHFEE